MPIDHSFGRIDCRRGAPRQHRMQIPRFDPDHLTDTRQHDPFARAIRQRLCFLCFHPQDNRLPEHQHVLMRKRCRVSQQEIEIFEMRGMVALNPKMLEATDRQTFEQAFDEIYHGLRSPALSLEAQAAIWINKRKD